MSRNSNAFAPARPSLLEGKSRGRDQGRALAGLFRFTLTLDP